VKGFKVRHNEYITEEQFLAFDEAERLIRAAATEWRTFIEVALKTGLRVGELLALKWEDVDVVAGQLVVLRTLWHVTARRRPSGDGDREGRS
jgi:integrase